VLHRASAHAIHLALGTTWPIQERVLKALFFRSEHEPPRRFVRALNFIAALLFVGCAIFLSMRQLTDPAGWNAVYKYRQLFLQGWLRTVAISIISLGLSLCVGLFLALARRSRFLPLRYCSRIYVELIRGTPLLVQILLLYYGVFHQVGIENRYIAGVLILSGFSGAYLAEIIRAGIESIGKSQLESARAIGLTDRQTFRYVVFPQMIRQVLPPLAGQFASLIKDSSLLSIIALSEFTQNAQNAASYTYSTLESYVPLAVGYLVLTLPISLWTQSLERRHHFDT
jgi:polar amino acid transport system permease protein